MIKVVYLKAVVDSIVVITIILRLTIHITSSGYEIKAILSLKHHRLIVVHIISSDYEKKMPGSLDSTGTDKRYTLEMLYYVVVLNLHMTSSGYEAVFTMLGSKVYTLIINDYLHPIIDVIGTEECILCTVSLVVSQYWRNVHTDLVTYDGSHCSPIPLSYLRDINLIIVFSDKPYG